MSNQTITYVVAVAAGVFGLAAYVGLILVPAWQSYSRAWERLAASFLSLYILAAFIGLGLAGGAAVVWFWDRIGT
jgi:O-antigen ligase